MAKGQMLVELTGRFYNASRELVVAKTSDAANVVCFIGPSAKGLDNEYFHVEAQGDTYVLTTPKGKYVLLKHPSCNYWHVEANGVKIHFRPKKVVAKLDYWA
jgi:hypothetical protein